MYIDKVKRIFRQLNIKSWFFIYILMQTIVPIVAVFTSKFLTTYFYMVVVLTAVIFTLVSCRLLNVREFALLLFPFIGYEILNMFVTNSDDYLLAGYQILLFLLPVCLGFYVFKSNKRLPIYAAVITALFAVTAITTIIGCIRNPSAARILASTASSQDATAIKFWWQNIGGYGFVYSAVLLYPCAVIAFKMKRLNTVVFILLTVLLYALVINAEYSLALMFLMVSTLLLFVKKDLSVKKFLLMLILFVLIVVLFRTTIAAILTRLGSYLGNEGMMEKINVLFLGKESVEGFDDARDELYLLSIKTFLSHPFFGCLKISSSGIGGHSFILDNLASFGLVGGALMFFMYRGIYKVFFQPFSQQPGYNMVFWVFLQTIILSTVNTGMWQFNLCVYAPIMFGYVYGIQAVESTRKDWRRVPARLIPKEDT
ncbi:MAG: hypothetical protein IJH32_10030 [Ruminococcus sp.]|nr:hypothetical protein [Ruminococcus sp.]